MESIPGFRLTSDVLKQFELLVLPEVDVLSSRHAEVIRRSVVWPQEQDLKVISRGGKLHVAVPHPERYTALYLKLA